MTATITDHHQREQALDPSRSFIIQAPAGSGKTELLIQRYLNLLATVDSPEEIVAITFTNKAAGEMVSRVVEALKFAQDKPKPQEPHKRKTWQLAKAVLKQSAQKDWNLTHHSTRMRIQTIDSFCSSITQQMPLLSGFGSHPKIRQDAEVLYQKAIRYALEELESQEQWSQAIEDLLSHLNNRLSYVESLLINMLKQRDQWLRHMVDKDKLSKQRLEQGLKHVVDQALRKVKDLIPFSLEQQLIGFLSFAIPALKNANRPSNLLVLDGWKQLPPASWQYKNEWVALAEWLLTTQGEWRKKITIEQGFPAASDAKLASKKKYYKEKKQEFTDFLATLSVDQPLKFALENLLKLPATEYTDQQWRLLVALPELLTLAEAYLLLVFQEQGEVDFIQVTRSALQALDHPDSPSDLALSLDYQIKHLLVDEFQDTSVMQFKLLELLTSGWQRNDGRSLFLVGDPMQSIYRFREADVGLYLMAKERGIQDIKLESLCLEVNFRSQQGIVDWVNKAFKQVLPKQADILSGAIPFQESVAFHGNSHQDAVMVHPFFTEDKSEQAKQVVEIVKQEQQQCPDLNIAILVRSRNHLYDIVTILQQAGLHYRAIEIEKLATSSIIQDLLALSKGLLHLADRTSWLSILRAPWCGLSLADLSILVGDNFNITLWDTIKNRHNYENLSHQGQRCLNRIQPIFQACFEQQQRQRLKRWVEGCWHALGGPACVEDATDLEDARLFFDLLDQLTLTGELEDFKQLDQQVDKLFAHPDLEADDSLQIMTIHKSKGLEFDIVIMPELGRYPPTKDKELLLWSELTSANQHLDTDLLLAPITRIGEQESQDSIYDYLRRMNAKKERYEDGRLLYVATTRTRYKLHLLGHTKAKTNKDNANYLLKPQSNTLLYPLWPILQPHFDLALNEQRICQEMQENKFDDKTTDDMTTENSLHVGIQPNLLRLTQDWHLPPPPPNFQIKNKITAIEEAEEQTIIRFDWSSHLARNVGVVVHRFIHQISEQGFAKWHANKIQQLAPLYRNALAQQGLSKEELAQATQRVMTALENILHDSHAQWIFSPTHKEVANEYPLTGIVKHKLVNIVIDRTFVDENNIRWIIDYKTSSHEGTDLQKFLDNEQQRYQPQLERYAKLMHQIDARTIKLGLYFPLHQAWRSWHYAMDKK